MRKCVFSDKGRRWNNWYAVQTGAREAERDVIHTRNASKLGVVCVPDQAELRCGHLSRRSLVCSSSS